MANTKSAIKRIRIAEKRHLRNQAVKSSTRTFVKRARGAIATNAIEAKGDLLVAISALDRAVKKGVIHRNNAARRKSRLVKRYNAAVIAVEAEALAVTVAVEEEKPAPAPKRTRSRAKK
ncbi:MAG: 30S ribosomal protein S20 [Chloroflexota bacterium]